MESINDLQKAVRDILVNNGLTELSLGEPNELNEPTSVSYTHLTLPTNREV